MSEFQGIDLKKSEVNNLNLDYINNYILSLQLSNFRNYKSYKAEFPKCPIAFIGKNGIGKTNILEAISLMQPGRGIRSVRLEDIPYNNSGNFGIHINLMKNKDQYAIGSSLDMNISRARKVKIDGKFFSPLILTNYLGVISLTPLMDKIFIESSSNRRRFVDRFTWIFFSAHAKNIREYEKVIKERNNLLKENSADNTWYNNLEKQIVKFGTEIIINRFKVIKLLTDEIEKNNINFPKGKITFKGDIEKKYSESSDIEVFKEKFLRALFDARTNDSFRGITSIGPHRTDLEVIYKEKNMEATLCSTGEQKSLLISIILAVAKAYKNYCNLSPILLLDEVFAHLDKSKREALSREIKTLNLQAFMTGTEESDFMTFDENSYIINLDKSNYRSAYEF